MFNFFHSLGIGITATLVAFTGFFHFQSSPAVQVASTSIQEISLPTSTHSTTKSIQNDNSISDNPKAKSSKTQSPTNGTTPTPISDSASTKTKAETNTDSQQVAPTVSSQQGTNLAFSVPHFYIEEIQYINGEINILNLYSTDADRYISGLSSLINTAQSYSSNPSNSDYAQLYNDIADLYTSDRGHVISMKGNINSLTSSLKNYINVLNNKIPQFQTMFVSKDEALAYLNSTSKDDDQIKASVDSLTTSYDLLTTNILSDKATVNSALQGAMNNAQARLNYLKSQRDALPVYTLPVINFTQTNCQIYGNSASCTSY